MKVEGSSAYQINASFVKKENSVDNIEKLNPIENQQEQQLMTSKLLEEEKKSKITKDEAEQIVNGINEFLKPQLTSLSFKLHGESDRYYVEVIDKETKKVIREIPEKELLDMYAKMTEFLGLFIDEKL